MFNKTIDGILKNFSQTVTDLRHIAEVKETKITNLNAQIMGMKRDVTDAGIEKDKATKIADKLDKLISGD